MKAFQLAIEIINVLFLEQIRLWPGFLPPLNRIKAAFLQAGFGFQKLLFLAEPNKNLAVLYRIDVNQTANPSSLESKISWKHVWGREP
ncbi:MAG TPA: hypothetical protein VG488_00885 [Candidatus Angelobacter sp.]|jgi:hypothetical protein|nr:hypothetical protein [Candidatus Angelobacter sp.]